MKDYYDQRAAEYDDWWEGTGLFASRERPGWTEERASLFALLAALEPARTLDVACGTGYLTRHLPGTVVALDQSARMLERAAVQAPRAARVRGDATALPFVDGAFERVVTGHFYGHLEAPAREAFLREARRVGRTLIVVDASLREGIPEEQWQERTLDDGTRWTVYKRFFTPAVLLEEIGPGDLLHRGRWFVVTRH